MQKPFAQAYPLAVVWSKRTNIEREKYRIGKMSNVENMERSDVSTICVFNWVLVWEQEESQLKQLLFNIVWFILLNNIIYDGLIDAMEYLHGL